MMKKKMILAILMTGTMMAVIFSAMSANAVTTSNNNAKVLNGDTCVVYGYIYKRGSIREPIEGVYIEVEKSQPWPFMILRPIKYDDYTTKSDGFFSITIPKDVTVKMSVIREGYKTKYDYFWVEMRHDDTYKYPNIYLRSTKSKDFYPDAVIESPLFTRLIKLFS